MRVLKVILVALFVALAAVAGVFVAAAALVTGAVIFFLRRLGGSSRQKTRLPTAKKGPSSMQTGEVIDISATEVPADLLHR